MMMLEKNNLEITKVIAEWIWTAASNKRKQ